MHRHTRIGIETNPRELLVPLECDRDTGLVESRGLRLPLVTRHIEVWMRTSAETYQRLLTTRRWILGRYERWLADTFA